MIDKKIIWKLLLAGGVVAFVYNILNVKADEPVEAVVKSTEKTIKDSTDIVEKTAKKIIKTGEDILEMALRVPDEVLSMFKDKSTRPKGSNESKAYMKAMRSKVDPNKKKKPYKNKKVKVIDVKVEDKKETVKNEK